MSWFQLDPESLADRSRTSGVRPLSAGGSVLVGTVGFTVMSVAGFAPWAVLGRWFHRHTGEIGLYAACALVFIGLSGPLLHRLIMGSGLLSRFYKLFAVSFTAYSVAWTAGWMALGGHAGSVVGLLSGTLLMGWIMVSAFDCGAALMRVTLILFLSNAAGYFLGGVLESALYNWHALSAKLSWGVCYGLGFGTGLGQAFHLCQANARKLLSL